MLHCDNDCLNMKINHGKPYSNVALGQRFFIRKVIMVSHGQPRFSIAL